MGVAYSTIQVVFLFGFEEEPLSDRTKPSELQINCCCLRWSSKLITMDCVGIQGDVFVRACVAGMVCSVRSSGL